MASSHLCLAMGMPMRDFAPGETGKAGGTEDESIPSILSSPGKWQICSSYTRVFFWFFLLPLFENSGVVDSALYLYISWLL